MNFNKAANMTAKKFFGTNLSNKSASASRISSQNELRSKLPPIEVAMNILNSPQNSKGKLNILKSSDSFLVHSSYTCLSALNKTETKQSFISSEISQTKPKIPYTTSISKDDAYEGNESLSPKYNTIHGKSYKNIESFLNNSLNQRPISEKIATRKLELAEKIRNITESCELEGAKSFSKCFLSAIHSIEELIKDEQQQYTMIKLIQLLHNNLKNFLDVTYRNTQKLKDEIEKKSSELKSIHSVHENELKEWEEKFKREKTKFEIKPLVQQFNSLKEKHHQLKINCERERKEMIQQNSLLTVNNKKLADRVKKIEEDADVMRTAATIQRLNQDLHQAQEMLRREKEEKSNMGFKLHTLLEATKTEVKEREMQITKKSKEFDELNTLYKLTKKELDDIKSIMKENQEKMSMTTEDILQTQYKIIRLKDRLKDKDKLIEEHVKKISELELQVKITQDGLVQKKEMTMESALFYFVWDNPLARMNNQSKYNSRKDRANELELEGAKKINDKIAEKSNETGEIKLDSINLGKYSYLRPTYRALISDLLPSDEHAKVSYLPPFPVWLHVIIRAIFDSKHTEILLSYNKGKKINRFPEFVYAWLGTFGIDKDTRGIKMLEYTEKETVARENRCNLLLGLEAASAAKLWEINVFKEFLEEELGLDELVYFLHCRNILFRGNQMAIPTAGFCVTHFVTKEKVFDTIDRIMYAYSADDRKELKKKLVDFTKMTYKDANAFDYAMVLRILLEFYRKEKKENFARFEELFTATKRGLKGGPKIIFPFDDFFKMVAGEYDKNISDQEVTYLYRESFIAGGCSVTCDSTLLTMSDTPFWIRYLRLKGQNTDPKYDTRGDIDQNDEKGKECAQVYAYFIYFYAKNLKKNRNWEENEEFFNKMKKQLTEYGAFDYLNSFDAMENYIRWKGKEDSAKHSGKSILRIFFNSFYI